MAEETVGEIYTKITADTDEFDQGVDHTYDRLEKLRDEDVKVQAETKGVENSVSSLATELALLGGALTTVFHYLHRSSGGLQALTSFAMGLIGAGLDTFLFEVLIPLWEKLTGAEGDNVEKTNEVSASYDIVAKKLLMGEDGMLKFKDKTDESNESFATFRKQLEDGKQPADEFGNRMYEIGDALFYYDGKTGEFIKTTGDLNTSILDLTTNTVIQLDMMDDVSDKYGVLLSDVQTYAAGGTDALMDMWKATGEFPGSIYASKIADAYEEVRIRLATLLVQMGINPMTGGEITIGIKTESQLFGGGAWGDAEKIAHYLLSGGN